MFKCGRAADHPLRTHIVKAAVSVEISKGIICDQLLDAHVGQGQVLNEQLQ